MASELIVGAVQVPLRSPLISPLESAHTAVALMRKSAMERQGREGSPPIDLFILPELAPLGYSEDTFANWLPRTDEIKKVHEEIDQCMAEVAKELNAIVCYGRIGTLTETDASFTIQTAVVSPDGKLIAAYNKKHLCNYGDCRETRFFVPGNKLCSFSCRGFQVGIIICADIRFPILSRQLAGECKVDLILHPSGFSRDFSFRTWNSFCETRAIENSVYFVSVNYSGDYWGDSKFNEPWIDEDHEPLVLGTEAGVLEGVVKRSTLDHVRKTLPYYQQLCVEFSK